ncbi:MAG: right-handed parallel beta-helix repeat-containing protein [Candidatus Hodarchaeales archaeon]|jgi:parallel beta-helix repeat protein
MMNKNIWIVLSILFFIPVLRQGAVVASRNPRHNFSVQYLDHTPIFINGNTDFITQAAAGNWTGNGTTLAPFLIQNINITGPTGSNLIEIKNTSLDFQIINCYLDGGTIGIFLTKVINAKIGNNTIVYNSWVGLRLQDSRNNTICDNTFSSNKDDGILLWNSVNNSMFNNVFYNNGESGINFFSSSGDNTIKDNVLSNNSLKIHGGPVKDYLQTTVANNTVNNKPLIFWQNVAGGIVPNETGQVILVNCSSIIVTNQILKYHFNGLDVIYCLNIQIDNNTIHDNTGNGIKVDGSVGTTITNNTIYNNNKGIGVDFSKKSTIADNIIYHNNKNGIFSYYSWNNTITNNSVHNNTEKGVELLFSEHFTLTNNTLSHNGKDGIDLSYSNYTTIFHNTISSNNEYGIDIGESLNITAKWNDFIDNGRTPQARGYDGGSNVVFSYNHWSDKQVPDVNTDGIVDLPYIISGAINDPYPLVSPSSSHPIIGLRIVYPNGTETLHGVVAIQWTTAINSFGRATNYSVFYSTNEGNTWIQLISNLSGTAFEWNTTSVADGFNYLVKIVATDSALFTAEVTSDTTFTILNDRDHDGLLDTEEEFWGTDPLNNDSDFDSLLDGEEVTKHGTNPINPDSDSDNLWDGVEVMQYYTNPLSPDSDADNLLDGDEVFLYKTDPNNPDTDNDGLWDDVEVTKFGTDPKIADTDADGVMDGIEVHIGLNPRDSRDVLLITLGILGFGMVITFLSVFWVLNNQKQKWMKQKWRTILQNQHIAPLNIKEKAAEVHLPHKLAKEWLEEFLMDHSSKGVTGLYNSENQVFLSLNTLQLWLETMIEIPLESLASSLELSLNEIEQQLHRIDHIQRQEWVVTNNFLLRLNIKN